MSLQIEEAVQSARKCEENPPPNESCTCDWVIVPILQALGYDRFAIVSRGADNQNQFPDYTILKGTEHEWFLEAKAWSVPLADNHATQALNYANQNGHSRVVLSNGREWRLYDNRIQGTPSAKLVATAHLSKDTEIIPFLVSISYSSLISVQLDAQVMRLRTVSVLDTQIADPNSEVVTTIVKGLRGQGLAVKPGDVVAWFKMQDQPPPQPPPYPLGGRGSLAQWTEAGQEYIRSRSPMRIEYPDGTSVQAIKWSEVAVEIVRWIGSRDQLPSLPWYVHETMVLALTKDSFYRKKCAPKPVVCPNRTVYIDTYFPAHIHIEHLHALCEQAHVDTTGVFITLTPQKKPSTTA